MGIWFLGIYEGFFFEGGWGGGGGEYFYIILYVFGVGWIIVIL